MKRITTYIILCFCLASCNFLDEQRLATITDPYSSVSSVDAQVRGIMKIFDSSVGLTGEAHEFIFTGSGILHWSHSGSSTRLTSTNWTSNLRFCTYATQDRAAYFFQHHYTAIDRCNTLLENLPDAPLDEGYKREIEGEVKFYRAWAYYNLVRMWGDVPLRLNMDNMSTLHVDRTKYDKVYIQIVRDLEDAYDKMRTPERMEQMSPGEGRPNKFAAIAYLSSVYTTLGSLLNSPDDNFWDNSNPERRPDFSALGLDSDNQALASQQAYTKALEYSEMLIPGSARHLEDCPYRLASRFDELYKWTRGYTTEDGTDCWSIPERIFVYNVTNQASSSVLARRTLPMYPEGTKDVSAYDGNYARTRPCRWVFQHWCETYPGKKGSTYSYNYVVSEGDTVRIETPGSKDIYESSADPRLSHSFYHTSYVRLDTKSTQRIYPYKSYLVTNPTNIYSMPYLKKYFSPEYNYNPGEADIYLMRLTEVYLNAAEAAARIGQEGKAYEYVEALHRRARLSVAEGESPSTMPAWSVGQFATADDLVTAIFWERVYELVGECHEWYDTHRFGAKWIVENISKPKNVFLNQKEQAGTGVKDQYGLEPYRSSTYGVTYKELFYGKAEKIYSEDWTEVRKGLLCELPKAETDYNNAIVKPENDFHY